jgi:hypothetical protein
MLVYGADGEITDLELVRGDHQEKLHKKTQQLLDKTDSPLHRDIAKRLVLDANPKLADDYEGQDKLAAAQMEIKRRISEMRLRDPSKVSGNVGKVCNAQILSCSRSFQRLEAERPNVSPPLQFAAASPSPAPISPVAVFS